MLISVQPPWRDPANAVIHSGGQAPFPIAGHDVRSHGDHGHARAADSLLTADSLRHLRRERSRGLLYSISTTTLPTVLPDSTAMCA